MIIKYLGVLDYQNVLAKMQIFTTLRDENTPDELWLLQHPSVYTQGIKDSNKHLLTNPNNIPVIKTDRGGQITYHGLGQLIIYCLIDIRRHNIAIKAFVSILEQSIIAILSDYKIVANTKKNAPGVYVLGAKIAALGLKVTHGKTYHGLSLNINMDLSPFNHINPCGYLGLSSINMQDLIKKPLDINDISKQLAQKLTSNLAKK